MKQKVIAMYRVSTEKQELERQQDQLRRLLVIDGYTEDQIIEIGNKESGVLLGADERKGIQEMKRHIEEGNIAAVYVHELSRLSRRAADTFMLRDYLQQHHVQLVCVNPSIKCFTDDWKIEPTANMIFGIMASMAENEGMIRKERMKTGKERCKKQGQSIGGRAKFGYCTEKVGNRHYYRVNEEQKAIVRRIYTDFLNGTSARQIAKQLYSEGLIWQPRERSREMFVYDILKDPAYLGVVSESGTEVYEPFVTEAEQTEAKARLMAAKKQPRTMPDKIVAYGLGLLVTPDKMAKNGHYTMCVHRGANQYKTHDGTAIVNADLADSLLLQVCNSYIRAFSKMDTAEIVKQTVANIEAKANAIKLKEERITKLQDLINGIENRLSKGKITEELADKLQDPHRAEIKRLKAEINENSVSVARLRSILKMDYTKELDMYAFGDEEARDTIKKYIDYVNVERVKNGTYSYEIHFTRTDRVERYMIRSKAHDYQRWNGEAWEAVDIRILNRYGNKAKEAMKEAA